MSEKHSTLYFVTGDEEKYKIYDDILDTIDLDWSEITVDGPQSLLFDVIIRGKIDEVLPKLPNLPFFVEHSGLTIRAWKNMPGSLTSIFMKTVGNEGICRMMESYDIPEEREAIATAVIGYCSAEGHLEIFRAEMPGTVAESPRGDHGYSWDAIFIPDGHNSTYAEMDHEELEQVSVRRIVASKFFNAVIKQHFQYSEVPQAVASDSNEEQGKDIDLGELRKQIVSHFDSDELNTLCFDMGINFDSLKGETLDGKAREVVSYCKRTLRLSELLQACREARPKADWDNLESD